jgi:hypothetical protein
MTKTIIPSAYLEHCPICNSQLNLSSTPGEKPTTCTNCDYHEPAGNAAVVTFLSASFAEYAALNEVDTAFLKGSEFTIRECMEGNGLLPLFIERAEQIQQASGISEIPGIGLQLSIIEDVKGLLMSRVVMKETSINIASTLGFLTEVLHETMLLTNTLDTKYYGNQICLDFMPCVNPTINVSETSAAKLHSALQVATKQQLLGAPGDRR